MQIRFRHLLCATSLWPRSTLGTATQQGVFLPAAAGALAPASTQEAAEAAGGRKGNNFAIFCCGVDDVDPKKLNADDQGFPQGAFGPTVCDRQQRFPCPLSIAAARSQVATYGDHTAGYLSMGFAYLQQNQPCRAAAAFYMASTLETCAQAHLQLSRLYAGCYDTSNLEDQMYELLVLTREPNRYPPGETSACKLTEQEIEEAHW